MDKAKKIFIICGICGSIIGFGLPRVDAAYAVIDSKNIAQQLKTYTETAKVALNTAQQATLLAKEVASLPADTLNAYSNAFSNSINSVNSAIQRFAIYNLTQGISNNVDVYWTNQFPKFKDGNIIISEDIFKQTNTTMSERRSESNKQTMQAYKDFLKELNDNQANLKKLLQESTKADGGLKAQQIANQISAIEANIRHIELNMDALKTKHQVEKDEAEITQKLNLEKLNEANSQAIENYISSLDTKGTWKAVRDPWKEHGASVIGW